MPAPSDKRITVGAVPDHNDLAPPSTSTVCKVPTVVLRRSCLTPTSMFAAMSEAVALSLPEYSAAGICLHARPQHIERLQVVNSASTCKPQRAAVRPQLACTHTLINAPERAPDAADVNVDGFFLCIPAGWMLWFAAIVLKIHAYYTRALSSVTESVTQLQHATLFTSSRQAFE